MILHLYLLDVKLIDVIRLRTLQLIAYTWKDSITCTVVAAFTVIWLLVDSGIEERLLKKDGTVKTPSACNLTTVAYGRAFKEI